MYGIAGTPTVKRRKTEQLDETENGIEENLMKSKSEEFAEDEEDKR